MNPLAALAVSKVVQNKWFWIFLMVLLLAVSSFAIAKQIEKRKRNASGKSASVDKGNIKVDTKQLETLARRLYNSMKGFNVWQPFGGDERIKAFDECLKLNDDEFKFVYNEFNQILGNETSETLRDWINSQSIVDYTSNSEQKMIERMDKLGLA